MPAKPVIFITEGETDDSFLRNLLVFHNIQECFFQKRACGKGGVNHFRDQLKALRIHGQREKFKEITLVADNDSGDGFERVKEEIRQANLDAPPEDLFGIPDAPRMTARQSQSLPLISILMLPWDKEPGCLETLCLNAINKKYFKEKQCTEKLVECVPATDWEISKKSKLMLRCFLSAVCKSEPNTGLLYAWSKENGRPGDIFPLDSPAFKLIADYLR